MEIPPANNDPIVEEVRRARDELARRFNYDIHAIFSGIRSREGGEQIDHPLVNDARGWAAARTPEMILNDSPPSKSLPDGLSR
jgi:hypothetical protein